MVLTPDQQHRLALGLEVPATVLARAKSVIEQDRPNPVASELDIDNIFLRISKKIGARVRSLFTGGNRNQTSSRLEQA